MAVAKTLIKAKAGINMSPDQILYQVNNELCKDNDSGMFVTIFLGILTISTGEVVFSNGGHNIPYLLKSNKEAAALPKIPGMALGVMEDSPYTSSKIIVNTGESLILYTDGVTEAMNPAGELFNDGRLVHTLRNFNSGTAKETVTHILVDTKKFVNGATQSDDITIFVLKYQGSKKKVYHLNGETEEIVKLSEDIENFAENNGIPQDTVFKINLSLDELLTNTLSYGYPEGGERNISVSLDVQDNTIVIETCDNAVPFNPLDKEEPDISMDIDERPIGGLGIHIVNKMMDEIVYRRENGFNILTMKKILNRRNQ
jgi:sigma-B regulation protein RsbU (phosphoserine phosphatase)